MHRVQGAGGHRRPAPQRQLLRRALPAAVPRPGGAGHQGLRHARAATTGRSSPCPAARTRWRCGTSSSSSATRPTASTSGSASATTATRRARWRAPSPSSGACTLHRGRPAHRPRLRHPDRRQGGPARAVLGVRPLEAPPVRRGRPHRRLRRRRHRPQPRRRGGGAVRQRAALADRLPRPAAAGAPGPPRLPAQGEAAGAPRRAGDGRVLRAARHRLHRRGVPDGRGQQAPRLQGGAQRHRGHVAGHASTTSTSGSSPGRPSGSPRGRGRRRSQLRRVRAAAARRPPARCAPSAGSSSGRPRSRSSSAGRRRR